MTVWLLRLVYCDYFQGLPAGSLVPGPYSRTLIRGALFWQFVQGPCSRFFFCGLGKGFVPGPCSTALSCDLLPGPCSMPLFLGLVPGPCSGAFSVTFFWGLISGPCYGVLLQGPVLELCSEALFRGLFPGPSSGAFYLSFVPEKCSRTLLLDLAKGPWLFWSLFPGSWNGFLFQDLVLGLFKAHVLGLVPGSFGILF